MIGSPLFRKFFWRYLLGFLGALALLVALNAHFFRRYVVNDWWAVLSQQARWVGDRLEEGDSLRSLVDSWRGTHERVRLLFFDRTGALIEDSHSELGGVATLEQLEEEYSASHFIVPASIGKGDRLVLVKRRPPIFPHHLQGGGYLILLLTAVAVALLLYPAVRPMSQAFEKLTRLARRTAAGDFGATLDEKRSDDLGELIEAFNHMSLTLAEAERLNRRLIQDVSHELRSPLARVRAFAETIQHRPDELKSCLKGIYDEVELLDRLVGDLLRSARMDSGAESLEISNVSLLEWGKGLFKRLEHAASVESIACETCLPASDFEIQGDSQRLDQAVGNVFDNAVRALRGRADAHIALTLAMDESDWWVSVKDNGPGVPESDRPHIFRRFYRVDSARSREEGGAGLGLSITRSIVEAHGGRASIESQEGVGTTITLRFPKT